MNLRTIGWIAAGLGVIGLGGFGVYKVNEARKKEIEEATKFAEKMLTDAKTEEQLYKELRRMTQKQLDTLADVLKNGDLLKKMKADLDAKHKDDQEDLDPRLMDVTIDGEGSVA